MSRGRKPASFKALSNWEDIFWNSLPTYIGIINNYFKNAGFEMVEIGENLEKLSFIIPKGLNSKEIKTSGPFPVISQSKEFIIGYSDREDLLVKEDLPLIIFGDHSKTVKFVDKPFVIGADGVKIIKPKKKFDERFFYYSLNGVITDTKNYGRHFGLLRKGFLPEIKNLKLQKSVVEFLDNLQTNSLSIDKEYFNKKVEDYIVRLQATQININNISSELTHQLSLVKKLRQQLLQDAVQGKLVAQNKNDEPASELLKKIKTEKEKLIIEKKLKKEKELPPIKPEEIPFEIPENWVWCRLGEIANNIEYGTSEKAEMSSDHIPVLRMNNIQGGIIDYEKLKYVKSIISDLPKLYLKKGDLLFNRTNSYELVGKSGVYYGKDDVMTFASYLIRVQFLKNVSVAFINYYINSSFCRTTQLEPDIIQQNGQANFNGTKLKNVICPFPPLKEQLLIVKKLDGLLQYSTALEESIKQSTAQNEKLLKQVVKEALQAK